MPQISQAKKQKISETILHYLFTIAPAARFTSEIASEIARDEEFTKQLLLELKEKKLVVEINKNQNGTHYKRRQRWALTTQAYQVYKEQQHQ